MGLKVVTVVGARPQFIKAAAVSRVIRDEYAGVIDEAIVHTGQHYDENMSAVFFDELDIPKPRYDLEVAGGLHGAMTGRMLEAIERVLVDEAPDWVLVYGDTNSTLAGALAAAKLHIPVAHVEAGLRSFNRRMPEEINRVLTDHVASLLFCPTETAASNLKNEGVVQGVHQVGDVMFDAALFYRDRAREWSTVLRRLGLIDRGFVLATCHRAENTDDPTRLRAILSAFAEIARHRPVVFPVHPRTQQCIDAEGLWPLLQGVHVVDPLPFLDMMALEQAAAVILTDSGGVQKEAFFFQVPCVTMRDETEWVETVTAGRNVLAGASRETIISSTDGMLLREVATSERDAPGPYGSGDAARGIAALLLGHVGAVGADNDESAGRPNV